MTDVSEPMTLEDALKCPGIGRDKDCISALAFYFNRRVTDDEMRFLHEVVQRAVAITRYANTDTKGEPT